MFLQVWRIIFLTVTYTLLYENISKYLKDDKNLTRFIQYLRESHFSN